MSTSGREGPRRVLIVVNVGWFFMSHRLPIALAAQKAGFDVHIASALDPELDRDTESQLRTHGLAFHRLSFSRSGGGPRELLRDFFDLMRLYARVRPHVAHLVTLKPILLGGIAARLSQVRNVVLAVPGRGSVFSAAGVLAVVRRWSALLLYRAAYRRGVTRIIVQNTEDREYFTSRHVFAPQDVRLIRGSGVDLDLFVPQAEPPGAPLIVFASRMLREKGVADFVAAARLIRDEGIAARFILVGAPDPGNPRSHTEAELHGWASSGVVEWWGFRSDMSAVLASCHVVCLPTYYGEGVPKALIEAAACGRPIVTTDTPGCRDVVQDGSSGYLVKPRDPVGLAGALRSLIVDSELRARMGRNARSLAQERFGLETVLRETLNVYNEFRD